MSGSWWTRLFGNPTPTQKALAPEPQAVKAARAPLDELIVLSHRDSDAWEREFTPANVMGWLRAAEDGDVADAQRFYAGLVERDPHLSALVQTRVLAVTGLEWQVLPRDDSELARRIADEAALMLQDIPGLHESLARLAAAFAYGFSIEEIYWSVSGRSVTPLRLQPVPRTRITFRNSLTPKYLMRDGDITGVEAPPHRVILHTNTARSPHMHRAALLRTVAKWALMKDYSAQDWAIFCERFGIPMRLGKYRSGTPEEERRELRRALQSLGVDASGLVPDSVSIEFIQTAASQGGNASVHERLIDACNREMSKAILGQTLTTDTTGSTGTYAAGKIHDQVRLDIQRDDARSLAATITSQLLRPWTQFNFGPDAPAPIFVLPVTAPRDLLLDSQVLLNLKAAGLGIPSSWVYERFGVPLPQEGDEVLDGDESGEPLRDTLGANSNRKPACSIHGGPQLHAAQGGRPDDPIFRLADKCLEEADPELAALRTQVTSAAAEALSYEDLFIAMTRLLAGPHGERMDDALARGSFTAHLHGRDTIAAETEEKP